MDPAIEIVSDILADLGQPFGIEKSDEELGKKVNEMLREAADTFLLYKMFGYPMYLLPYVY